MAQRWRTSGWPTRALTYTKVPEKRHPVVVGQGLAGQSGDLVSWRDGARAFAAESRGAEVLILEQVPATIADGLREAIWRVRAQEAPAIPPPLR